MRFILFTALLALAACGQSAPTTYPPQYELNFMRACQAQGPAQGICPCIWGKIVADVPPADFAAFELLSAEEQAQHPLNQQIERYALECAAELPPPSETPPAP